MYELTGGIVWVELADACYEQRPGDASKETKHVGIDAPPLGPALDKPECLSKGLLIWHQLQDLVSHAGSIQASDALLVHVLEHLVMTDRCLRILPILKGPHEFREDQVDRDVLHLELDDRRISIWNWHAIIDTFVLLQLLNQGCEECVAADVWLPNAQCRYRCQDEQHQACRSRGLRS